MPREDGTSPIGKGPMAGYGAGDCAPGFINNASLQGHWERGGSCWSRRNGFYATDSTTCQQVVMSGLDSVGPKPDAVPLAPVMIRK